MSAELRLRFDPELPEWRRSGRFFVVAATLHLAVLAWPLSQSLEIPPPEPLTVRLIEALQATPEPLPVISPPAPPPKPLPAKPKPLQTPPVLAMTPEQQAPTAAPAVVAAPPVAAPSPSPAAVTTAPVAAPAVIAARYNAAYLNNPQPKYPALSRRLGEEGKVLLKVRVSAEGLPIGVDLEKSSNFARLDEAARLAVAAWRFVPARRGDEAIEAAVIVPIVFRLQDG
ncbi:MAG: energy transducer TonB [Betaproteobacteria bacterium HGW-Betaproteobacteria-12]|nr:MAG: energy transducer TonB [Betaproteobacteria bacterium HGW-Betaproteobacteria-12]